MNGQTETVRSLLNTGANINAQDDFGHTPLVLAIMNHRARSARLLVASGADIEIHDKDGRNALDTLRFFDPYDKELATLLKESDTMKRGAASSVAERSATDYNGPDPNKPDFFLGDNLSDDELMEVNQRVQAEKERRRLSDLQTMQLMNAEIHKASVAKYRRDHPRR